MSPTTMPPAISTHWKDLPDPEQNAGRSQTCDVEVPEHVWQHIVTKHFQAADEPWEEVFSAADLAILSQPSVTDSEAFSTSLQAASEALCEEAIECLQRPLAIQYTRRLLYSKGPLRRKWLLVLPRGAIVILAQRSGGKAVATAFIPNQFGRSHTRENRWMYVMFHYRNRYAIRDPETGELTSPDPEFAVPVPRRLPDEDRFQIQFVTEESWQIPGPMNVDKRNLLSWPSQRPGRRTGRRPGWMRPRRSKP